MRYPLAADFVEIVPTRHPAHPDRAVRGPGVRRTAAFLGFLIALAAMIALPASPARGGESIWTHNGSTVRWVSSGKDRWMYYLQPRPGLAAIGVQPGALLFRGQRIGNILSGMAFVFSEICPPTPYRVEGIVYSENDVRLDGAVPVVDPASCQVVDYTWDSYNAALRFHYVMRIDSPPVVAWGRGCTVDDPTGTPLNVRASPNGPILGALYNGTSVEVRDVTFDRTGRRWAYVAPLGEGKRGWVFRAHLDWIGDVLKLQDDREGALKEYKVASGIARDMATSNKSSVQWQRNLTISYIKIGDLLAAQDRSREALEQYQQALEIVTALPAKYPQSDEWPGLAESLKAKTQTLQSKP